MAAGIDDPLSPAARLMYAALQLLAHLALPLLLLALVWRARKEPAHLAHLSHRFGLGPAGPGGAIWVYAASLGETRAVSPLVRRLLEAGHHVLLTSQSPAGLAEARRLFGTEPRVTARHVPADLDWAVRLFLARARPRALLVAEIELWPAMLRGCRRAGVPVAMVNGNLLDQSMQGRGRLRRWLLGHYRLFDRICTRTEAYRSRYQSLGVEPSRIAVVGELKYDQWIDPAQVAAGQRLRAAWPADAPVLMIASSVKDEEPALLALVQALRARPGLEGLRLVWAPRSPQRFDAVARALTEAGFAIARRSALGPLGAAELPAGTQVLLGDSTGEMNVWYPMADLVFVGASLTDDGGHNIMEPMALGRPVVMGPSIYGIAFAAEPAAAMGGFASLPDAAALEARIAALFADRAALARMAAGARAFAATQTGAATRTLDALRPLLGP
ncbi:MAG: 3-deoxy-D-manno-octulosonic acid transferase [Gemmobacter sp.]|uniref:3-deoxy-D-manno-octulosonic acid transferase n=1 Tax=Gemmobacter sp. TaxID=1898957 RepID=UPI00391B4A8F